MRLSIRCAANGLPILVWPSLVRRLIWVQEIAGSNPATKTKRRVGRAVEGTGLENQRSRKASEGSNPSLSATVEVGVGTQGGLISLSAPD